MKKLQIFLSVATFLVVTFMLVDGIASYIRINKILDEIKADMDRRGIEVLPPT